MAQQNSTACPRLRIDGAGSRTPLLLANSLAATSDMWDAQMNMLTVNRSVFRFDYPGHNGVDDAQVSDTVDSLAINLLEIMSNQGVESFDFAGISLGGLIGLQIATRSPNRIRRLVASNFRPFQPDESKTQWASRVSTVKKQGCDAIADATLTRWMSTHGRQSMPETAAILRRMIAGTTTRGYIAGANAVCGFDFRDTQKLKLKRLLLISSTEDTAAPAEDIRKLSSRIGADYLEINTSAHLPNCELPDQYNSALDSFFS